MPAGLSIRVATPEDAEAVTAVLQDSFPQLLAAAYQADILDSAMPAMAVANPTLLACGTYHLAEAEGEVVGCGGWTFEKPGTAEVEPGLAHLRHFGTRAGWAGLGIGRRIYERCEAEARAADVKAFECYSTLNAEPFYASLGFERVSRIEVAMRNGAALPSILMRRRLP